MPYSIVVELFRFISNVRINLLCRFGREEHPVPLKIDTFLKLPVSPMQPVQESQESKVLVELQMVVVVIFGRALERQVVSTVDGQRGEDGEHHVGIHDSNVRAKNERAASDGRDVGEQVFHGVTVRGSPGNGRHPLMVHLVDVLVQEPVVHCPVGVEEHDLGGDREKYEMRDKLKEPREFEEAGPRPVNVDMSPTDGDGRSGVDNEQVEEDDGQEPLHLRGMDWLIDFLLNLVLAQEGRLPRQIHENKESAVDQVHRIHDHDNQEQVHGGEVGVQGQGKGGPMSLQESRGLKIVLVQGFHLPRVLIVD